MADKLSEGFQKLKFKSTCCLHNSSGFSLPPSTANDSSAASPGTIPNGAEAEAEDSDDDKDEDGAADTGPPGGMLSQVEPSM